ncbi:hypothetical protein, partial [Weissella cibaria]|uniref:hypothetical protein n=1 Tax=Weissella cibaria TaxID=137591 RepID=UPI001ADC14F3
HGHCNINIQQEFRRCVGKPTVTAVVSTSSFASAHNWFTHEPFPLKKKKSGLCGRLDVANHPHNPDYKNSIIDDFSQNFLRPTPFDKEPKKTATNSIQN